MKQRIEDEIVMSVMNYSDFNDTRYSISIFKSFSRTIFIMFSLINEVHLQILAIFYLIFEDALSDFTL